MHLICKFRLRGGETMIISGNISDLFVHCAGLGLAAILEKESGQGVGIRWVDQEHMEVRPEADLDDDEISAIVKQHAAKAAESEWLSSDTPMLKEKNTHKDRLRSPLSPRVGSLDDGNYRLFDNARNRLIDSLDVAYYLELRFLCNLGRPAYWSNEMKVGDAKNKPDNGASFWEMGDRRRGDDFVRCRLRKLAKTVSERDHITLKNGLVGIAPLDEIAGKNAIESTTATGLRGKGITDNAQAWCALWAISLFPVRPVVSTKNAVHSNTIGVFKSKGAGVFFCLPIFKELVTLERVRGVLRSSSLYGFAQCMVKQESGVSDLKRSQTNAFGETRRLERQKVFAIGTFFRNYVMVGNAVDYWAEAGTIYLLEH